MYALKTLQSRCMPTEPLHEVKRDTVVAKLFYASPAWWGYLSKSDLHRLEGLIHRATLRGLIPEDGSSFDCLALQMDKNHFQVTIPESRSCSAQSLIQMFNCRFYILLFLLCKWLHSASYV